MSTPGDGQRRGVDRALVTVVVATAVLVGIVLVAALLAVLGDGDDDGASARPGPPGSAPANTTADYGVVYTPQDAGGEVPAGTEPVPVELYEDFQCPACRRFEQQTGGFLRGQVAAGAITITYRPFSFLDELGGSTNDYSKRATNAALCALDRGGPADYVTVHDHLYENQPAEGTAGPPDAELVAAVRGLGIDDVDGCITGREFVPWVEAAKAHVMEQGVSSTPTVVVDGQVVEGAGPGALRAAIAAAAGRRS